MYENSIKWAVIRCYNSIYNLAPQHEVRIGTKVIYNLFCFLMDAVHATNICTHLISSDSKYLILSKLIYHIFCNINFSYTELILYF